jgi:cyclic pyranopterin phosphate synthase
MPEQGIKLKKPSVIMSYEKILAVIKTAVDMGFDKVRLTGGEPLVRKDITYLIQQIKSTTGIRDLSLTTNGVYLAKMAHELKEVGLDRLNVSLDTLSPEKYKKITRIGDINHALRGIDAALEVGFLNTKINMVVIPGLTDEEVLRMRAFCQTKGLVLQRINHYSLRDLNRSRVEFQAERPPPCSKCNRIRLTSEGKFKPCLFSDLEYEVDSGDIESSVKKAISNKPLEGTYCKNKQNWQIGG